MACQAAEEAAPPPPQRKACGWVGVCRRINSCHSEAAVCWETVPSGRHCQKCSSSSSPSHAEEEREREGGDILLPVLEGPCMHYKTDCTD